MIRSGCRCCWRSDSRQRLEVRTAIPVDDQNGDRHAGWRGWRGCAAAMCLEGPQRTTGHSLRGFSRKSGERDCVMYLRKCKVFRRSHRRKPGDFQVFGPISRKSSAVHHLPSPSVMGIDSSACSRMKRLAATAALLFLGAKGAEAGALTIAWDPASDPSVTGYNVYWGTQSGVYTERGERRTADLVSGRRPRQRRDVLFRGAGVQQRRRPQLVLA